MLDEKQLIHQLGQLKKVSRPNKNWLNNSRRILLSEMENEKTQSVGRFSFLAVKKIVFRPVATYSLIVALLFVTSFATINASKYTLPGDALYSVKMMAETIKYNLAFSDESQTRVAMNMAQERMEEMRIITSTDVEHNQSHEISKNADKILANLNNIQNKINNVNSQDKIALAHEVDEKLTVIEQEVNQAVEDSGHDEEIKNKLNDIISQINKTSIVVLATLVDEKEAGQDISLNDEELKSKVEDQVSDFENKLIDTETMNEAYQELENIKQAVNDGDYKLALEMLSSFNDTYLTKKEEVKGDQDQQDMITDQAVTTTTTEEQVNDLVEKQTTTTVPAIDINSLIIKELDKVSEEFGVGLGN